MIRIVIAFFTLVFAAAPALAADRLSDDQVARFVATMAPVQTFGDGLEKEGKLVVLIGGASVANGAFKPYSAGVDALKTELPADFQRFAAVVKPHGFTPEQWGAVGDRVMAAYMALRIERDEPDALSQMEALDDAMIEEMPAEIRQQMKEYLAMMEAVKAAPDADKKAVRPAMEKIDAYIAAQNENAGAK